MVGLDTHIRQLLTALQSSVPVFFIVIKLHYSFSTICLPHPLTWWWLLLQASYAAGGSLSDILHLRC